jgi:CRISPR-associated endonuclease Csy4
MSHYLDIHLRRDPEFPAHQLMAALYSKLHRAFVQTGNRHVAVSFPGYSTLPSQLGNCLRLIGPEAELRRLHSLEWLHGMRDHVDVKPPAIVPKHAQVRALRRVQAKSSPERLRRRQMRRHGLSAEEARQRIPDSAIEKLRLPFVQLASSSTGQRFCLFLKLDEPASGPIEGEFNAYGLSATATIPWF